MTHNASMPKRAYGQAFPDGSDEYLTVKLQGVCVTCLDWLLRAGSTVACGLPKAASTWDLSGLLINGQPVSRDVLVAWLNAAYHHLLGATFEPQDPDLTTTAAGLSAVLHFADAVGSRPGLLAACLRNLDQLQLAVQLGGTPVALIAGEHGLAPAGPCAAATSQLLCWQPTGALHDILQGMHP
jgi:hypothetical protein